MINNKQGVPVVKTLFICLATLGIILPGHASENAAHPSAYVDAAGDVFRTIAQSAVRVRRDPHAKNPGSGSGTIVESDERGAYVLTAEHVVAEESAVLVDVDTDGAAMRTFPGLVVKRDHATDLALLRVLGNTERPARPIASTDPELYADLYIVSAPLRITRQAAIERLNTKDAKTMDGHVLWTITGMMLHGMSGGGITNAAGELVCVAEGVSTWGKEEYPHMGVCTPLPTIREFLKGEKL